MTNDATATLAGRKLDVATNLAAKLVDELEVCGPHNAAAAASSGDATLGPPPCF